VKKKRIEVLQWSSQSPDLNAVTGRKLQWTDATLKKRVNHVSSAAMWEADNTGNNNLRFLLLKVVLQAAESWLVLTHCDVPRPIVHQRLYVFHFKAWRGPDYLSLCPEELDLRTERRGAFFTLHLLVQWIPIVGLMEATFFHSLCCYFTIYTCTWHL